MSSDGREIKKYTDFQIEEIEEYLDTFKRLVRGGRFTISQNEKRLENIDFMNEYDINTEKAKMILLSLDAMDFCYAVDNEKVEYAHEKLYVFCKACDLDNRGDRENVEIYLKSNITETKRGNQYMIVISFHKRNNPITYCFK